MTEPKETWTTMKFKDVPVRTAFWVHEYECFKVSETHSEFSGDVTETDPEMEVGVLTIG